MGAKVRGARGYILISRQMVGELQHGKDCVNMNPVFESPERTTLDGQPSAKDGEPSSTSAHQVALDLGELEIREIALADVHLIYELGEEVFTSDKWPQLHRTWDEYEVLDAIMNDRETSLVAVMGDKVVGFALGVLIEKKNSAWVYGYLKWLAVDPDVGRKGVAGALFKELRSLFIQNGARMLLVDTHAENDGALRFFEKNGFGNQEDHVYLSLNLTHEKDYLRHKAKSKKA